MLPSLSSGLPGADRAQSESIGVILLTAVIVILVGGFGVVYLGALDDGGQAPLVDAEINATGEWLSITHGGGESVSIDELEVLVRVNGTNQRFAMDPENVTDGSISGGDDGTFDPGDRFARDHNLGSGQMEVLFIHIASNEVIQHAYLDAIDSDDSEVSESPVGTFEYTPSNPTVGETVTFDASDSTADGEITRYEWDWNGDGIVDDSSSDPPFEHDFASSGSYDVTLTVVDENGNTNRTSRSVSVGSVPPSIEDTTLTDGDDDIVTTGDTVSVSATIGAGSSSIDTVVADASAFGAGDEPMSDGNGDGTYEAMVEVGPSAAEGAQLIQVSVTDTNGNSDTATTDDGVMVDTTVPEIQEFSVTDRSEGGSWLGFYIEAYRIQWSVTDERSGIASSTVYVNRTDGTQATYSNPSGDREYNNTRGFFVYSGRDHTITIVAVDEAGNRACRTVTDTADGSDPPASAYEAC